MKSFKFSVALAAFIVLGYTGFAQQPTVQQLIIQVSKGWQADAKKALPDLLLDKPDDPAVMFLHATLVDDPKRALPLYERIIERFSGNEWADDALLRLIIFYTVQKEQTKSVKYFQQFRQLYPQSELLPVAYDIMRMTVGSPPAESSATEKRVSANTHSQAATAPVTTPPLASIETITTHPYTIAITTTPDKAEAQKLVTKYTSKNLKVNMAEKWIKGKRNYVVQVGWYISEVAAAADIDAVRKVCNCKPIVTRRMP
ncbi:MAG: hypothetical protein D8M52_04585 [Chlorobi bacterium]|nr:MAG: hypothetical protein F9K28_03715 [Bacteroidota bacterium]KXK34678.1 MAG: Outer membrane protein assembly factor BamD [Chlorobi bacterium OLB6]MBE2265231.1 hypothetical protein [Flavobacteriales bacterium]MBL1160980.1 hypothetical protein [Chlorobiota bacterium]MBW7852938.1 hypothetical protein [Candidatus Kapabacteria bacterium]MCC6330810.1 hypothetical protein [Ignavibacteria bacterium]